MLVVSFFFVRMGQFPLSVTMSPALSMTAELRSGETRNLSEIGICIPVVGGRCTVDSAFSASRSDYLIRSANTNYVGETRAEFAASVTFNAEATSMRQLAEWGMRTFQASFPRIKDRFVYEERGERKRILKLCFFVYNVRARRVGINQLHSVYLEHLDRNPTDLYG